jgi:hypothetical protein
MPENERKDFLWALIMNAYDIYKNQNENQIENQNENQIECANVSVSVSDSISVLSNFNKLIFNSMQKTVRFKKFSSNYGGTRKGSGRPKATPKPNIDAENIFGEYGNVSLTKEQYGKLLGMCASEKLLNELINSFSVNIEVGKERPYIADLPNAHYERLKSYYNYRKKNPDKFSIESKEDVWEKLAEKYKDLKV